MTDAITRGGPDCQVGNALGSGVAAGADGFNNQRCHQALLRSRSVIVNAEKQPCRMDTPEGEENPRAALHGSPSSVKDDKR
jgi:hypothetical protein